MAGAPYRVEVLPSALRETRRFPHQDIVRIREHLAALGDQPFPAGVEKLQGHNLYRLRVGRYRIIYHIDHDVLIITVIKIGHRKNVYRGF